MSDTPETDNERTLKLALEVFTELANTLKRERDEARAIAYDLASVASHCLGWHDHESSEAAERIADTLKRWKSAGKIGNPTN